MVYKKGQPYGGKGDEKPDDTPPRNRPVPPEPRRQAAYGNTPTRPPQRAPQPPSRPPLNREGGMSGQTERPAFQPGTPLPRKDASSPVSGQQRYSRDGTPPRSTSFNEREDYIRGGALSKDAAPSGGPQRAYPGDTTPPTPRRAAPQPPMEHHPQQDETPRYYEADGGFSEEPPTTDNGDAYEYDDYDDNEIASKKANKGCLIAFIIALAIVVGTVLFVVFNVKAEIDGKKATATETVAIDVEKGYGGRTIGRELQAEGMISSANIFRFYVSFTDVANFQVGRFMLEPGMSYDEIIEALTAHTAKEIVQVTIPEGSTVYIFADAMEKAGLCTAEEFIEEANNGNFNDIAFFDHLDYSVDTYMRAEGFLAANTYDFYKGVSVHELVRRLYEQFNSEITPEMYQRMDEVGLSLMETITLASLIEEESGLPEHQAAVSGVFWNRLKGDLSNTDLTRRTMGSDVTFFYIRDFIARSYDGNYENVPEELFYAYYTADNDPKTREGLPVGPISSPSKTAIQAALWPEEHNYFYFLTDFYGTYYYAQTYAEHERNVATMNRMNAQYEAEHDDDEADAA